MLTKTDYKKLQACFKQVFYILYPDDEKIYGRLAGVKMFPVWDEKLNEKLCAMFGLNINDNLHEHAGYVFNFDWALQLWRVGA